MMIAKNFHKLFSTAVLLFFLLNSTIAFSQQMIVTGRVTDKEDGVPIPGVSVKLKGTTGGTTKNSEGNYKVTIPPNATAMVRLPGAGKASVTESGNPLKNVKEIKEIEIKGEDVNLTLGSGIYHFEFAI